MSLLAIRTASLRFTLIDPHIDNRNTSTRKLTIHGHVAISGLQLFCCRNKLTQDKGISPAVQVAHRFVPAPSEEPTCGCKRLTCFLAQPKMSAKWFTSSLPRSLLEP